MICPLRKDNEHTSVVEVFQHVLQSSLICSLQMRNCNFHSLLSSHMLAIHLTVHMVATNTISDLKCSLSTRACHDCRSLDLIRCLSCVPFQFVQQKVLQVMMYFIFHWWIHLVGNTKQVNASKNKCENFLIYVMSDSACTKFSFCK